MTRYHDMAITEAKKLARKGRLVDAAFKAFQRQVFPDAPPDQIAALRIAFFAGAGEVYALMMHGLDAGKDPTDGDMEFMSGWTKEIERFHTRTIRASQAGGRKQ